MIKEWPWPYSWVDWKFSFDQITFPIFVNGWMIIMITHVFKEFIPKVGLICLCCLRVDKLTSAVDKLFEGINKAVCECISHSQLDNMNYYQTDEDFLWTDMAQLFEQLTIFCERMAQPFGGWRFWHVLKPKTTKWNNQIELLVVLSKHCMSIV